MTAPQPVEAFPAQHVHDEGAHGATIRWVITEADGSDTYALRVIELEPHGNTPHHTHWFEQRRVPGQGWRRDLRAGRRRASVSQHRCDAAAVSVWHSPAVGERCKGSGTVRRPARAVKLARSGDRPER